MSRCFSSSSCRTGTTPRWCRARSDSPCRRALPTDSKGIVFAGWVRTVGGVRPSSFRIVPVPCASEMAVPIAADRLTTNVSFPSVVPSPLMGTLTVCVAGPPTGNTQLAGGRDVVVRAPRTPARTHRWCRNHRPRMVVHVEGSQVPVRVGAVEHGPAPGCLHFRPAPRAGAVRRSSSASTLPR